MGVVVDVMDKGTTHAHDVWFAQHHSRSLIDTMIPELMVRL